MGTHLRVCFKGLEHIHLVPRSLLAAHRGPARLRRRRTDAGQSGNAHLKDGSAIQGSGIPSVQLMLQATPLCSARGLCWRHASHARPAVRIWRTWPARQNSL